ncbi:UNVERIFIED_CONTAM: hypothetical protein GTU68_013068 [Idotea baltica]|nr:hypothetical protein [Idotea baltica]
MTDNGGAVRIETQFKGQLWRVFLDRPKGNILDAEMVAGLTAIFNRASGTPELKLITLEGAGANFSYGASVAEHMPGQCAGMLDRFHRMFFCLLDSEVAVHAIVRGYCLGGGLELAALCHRVYCAPDAKLGQPEIALGVIAPVASVVLPERIGRGAAEDLCLSGRSIDAVEAHRIGLVDQVDEDPWQACTDYFEANLLPRSASSLRIAVHAIRKEYGRRFESQIRELEAYYLERLMATEDALEGLVAFTEKRKPIWKNK